MAPHGLVVLGIFALLGFILKVVILFNISIKSKVAECFTILCFFFLFQNLSEFLGYMTYPQSVQLGEIFVNLYMVSLYFIFPSIFVLALALTGSKHIVAAQYLLYGAAVLVSVAHAGGFIISGFEFVKWSVITTPAEYSWVSSSFMLSLLAISIGYLIHHYRSNKDFEIRSRCKVNLVAMIPLTLVAVGVPALRAAGFHASTAIAFPIATILFLFVMLLQTNGNLFWISLRLKLLLTIATMKNIETLDGVLARIEEVRIREALRVSNGKQVSAASLLNLPPSTLCKKIAKYNIERQVYQR